MSLDTELEQRLGRVLTIGVRTSSVLLALGLILSFVPAASPVATWLMLAGLVMLLATPVARVAMSVIEYAAYRDWTFFTLTTIVLLELCAGIVAALVFHRRL